MIRTHAVLHVHSTYSYDGKNSLEEIAKKGKSSGKQIICMTEHTDHFAPERMDQFIQDCNTYSDETILLIPGLEVTCTNGLHIMGIGLKKFVGGDTPETVIEKIAEAGGIAALSHPLKHGTPEIPGNLAFMEIWNGKCAGRVLPDFKVLKFFEKAKKNNPALKCVAGLDFHQISHMANLDIVMDLNHLRKTDFLEALREGRYQLQLGIFTFDSKGAWPYTQRILAFTLSGLVRLRDHVKGFLGIKMPSSLEALIKRLVGQGK